MNKMRLIIGGFFFLLLWSSGGYGQDKLSVILRQELSKQMEELKKREFPPYYMNYRVEDEYETRLGASFGVLTLDRTTHERALVPQIRIGSPEFDNFKSRAIGCPISRFQGPTYALLPLGDENSETAIRQAVWNEVNNRYKYAVEVYQTEKAGQTVNVAEDDKAPCFSEAPVEKYYEEPLPLGSLQLDKKSWGQRLKEITAIFKKYPEILEGEASLRYTVRRLYFMDTDGREIVQNLTYARIMVSGMTKADDGMELPLHLSYFAFIPEGLPSQEKIVEETRKLAEKLMELRNAPIVEPFTGPAILSGKASGVFFHEIFGHRIEGQRMKSGKDAQTFKKMVGEYVLAPEMQVYADPTLKHFAGTDMNGYFKFDDQGVRAQRVDVVVDGKLNDFLMTRVPLDGHPKSNGHARASVGYDPVSRQSNLIVETKAPKTEKELRELLIREAKAQGKECGYYFKEVTGGFTMTGRSTVNSFNVTPLEVYEVYVDGRPDRLVRGVDLIGTPLSMFANIMCAGGEPEVFTGTCGAESGGVPVTACSPTILVKKVEMQRKKKATALPPVLGSPEKASVK